MIMLCSCREVKIVREDVKEAVQRCGREKHQLLEILGQLQKGTNFLERDTLVAVAEELDLPLAEVYGTATFYSLYSTKPRGRYVVRVCESAPCHIDGAADILAAVKAHLGVAVDETTDDSQFTLETTSCLGVCSVGPAMMINDEVYGNLTPDRAVEILQSYN